MDRHGPGGGALHNRGTGAPSHRPRVSSMAPLLSGSSFASSTGDVRDVQSVRSELADQPGRNEPGEAGWDRGDRVPGTVAGGNWLFGPDARPRRRAANLPAGTRRDLEKRNPSPLPASFVRMVAVGATTEHQRRDARRKRALVVAAARAAFAEQGIDVSVDEIVERAGAGTGTIYRHLPHRVALVDAIFEERTAELVEVVERAPACEDTARGLRLLLLASPRELRA